ncbi:MAG: PSD1 and planctomycete cytochrome C domain-containing protein [Chthoniobacteraceae bacterium]
MNPFLAHQAALTQRLLFLFAFTQVAAGADSPEAIVFFEKRIRPVLVDKCYKCHAADAEKIKGGLLLDTRKGIRQGGDNGPAVVPGDVKRSLLIEAIRHLDKDLAMPPKEKLPDAVIEEFEKWIAMGAPDPREGGGAAVVSTIDIEEGRKHWAFQPISTPPVPAVKDSSWPRTDIDRFVLAALEAKGLRPVEDAAPAELRRRIAFDLTGLPPHEPDGSQEPQGAHEQIARHLQSPRFGERWARHWLDVARYAESSGSGHNVAFPLAFRYRDWVVDSLNADKPYDRFIREQLAGDLLPSASDAQRNEQLIATGFLAVGVKDLRENKLHRFRMAIADEQIDATSRAFLGLTIACAKCHDHKFDPIPTADYYALAGIFTSSEPMLGARRNREREPFAAGVIPLAGGSSDFTNEDQRTLLKLRVDSTYKRLALRDEKLRILRERGLSQTRTPKIEAMLDQLPSVQKFKREVDEIEARYEAIRVRYDAAMPHSVMGMRDVKPADCAIHIRGEDTQLGDVVPRGFPRVLTTAETMPVKAEQSGRLQLAEWIADPRHPLTARVMANRIWQHLFGMGLVETPDDFGRTGQPPSDPALLDHLAQRFLAHGWSVKKLIAEIMNSRVYRLGTAHDAKAFEIDPANRLHWRMNRRRLDSDALLDAIRSISGDLVIERPRPVFLSTPQDDRVKSMDFKAWVAPTLSHRTIFQPVLRDRVPDEWSLFDFPVPELVTGRRSETTVPTQALYMMNSPFIVEQSARTAKRLLARASEPGALIAAAYVQILNRAPNESDYQEAQQFLKQIPADSTKPEKAAAVLCQMLFASAEFRYLY